MIALFKWSTPAANPDGTSPDAWRVADLDVAAAVLADLGHSPSSSCAERDGDAVWIGLRDNRDPSAHSLALLNLADQLRLLGLMVRVVYRAGRPVGLRIIDPLRGQRCRVTGSFVSGTLVLGCVEA